MAKMVNIQDDDRMLKELGLNNKNPFTTPEGYFDTLNDRIMARIDEEEMTANKLAEKEVAKVVDMKKNPSIKQYLAKWAVAAAACLALVFVGVNYYGNENSTIAQNQTVTEEYDEEYDEDMMSYSMMDEGDVYCYLAGIE